MKKKITILSLFLMLIGLSFALPNKPAKAFSGFNIAGVASAHVLQPSTDPRFLPTFWRPTGYTTNNHTPITLTTDYPCITTYAATRYIYQHIWIDGEYKYDQLGNTQIMVYQNYGSETRTDFVINGLTPGRHNIKIIADTSGAGDTITDDITVVLP